MTAFILRASLTCVVIATMASVYVVEAQAPDGQRPLRALVVSGGGAKGAYAAGVLSILMRDGIPPRADTTPRLLRCDAPKPGSLTFDVLVGTSTGALITPLAHQHRIREMSRFYTTYGTSDVLAQRPLFETMWSAPSLYTVDQLQRLLLEEYAATGLWTRIRSEPRRLLVVTGVDLQRSSLVLFYAGNPTNREVAEVGYRWEPIADESEFLRAILASSSEPVGMPPVLWNRSFIWDGGVRSAMPVSVALAQKGVQEVWVIGLNPSPDSPMGWHAKPPGTGFEVLLRTIDVFGNNVVANDLAKMDLLVKGWRERFARTVAVKDIENVVRRETSTLPDSVRIPLMDSVESHTREFRAIAQVEDTVLGAPSGDQRNRVQVFVIRPFESLPGTSLENTLQDQQRMYLHGQKDARQFLTWLREECMRLSAEPDSLSVYFRVFAPVSH